MLRQPSMSVFHHQAPRGSDREIASAMSPAGRARSSPDHRGWSAGRNRVVTTYVVPHTTGANAVDAARPHDVDGDLTPPMNRSM